jgi:large-conductance mechanosensitive channel
MKATASSTRLPRITKSLKPFIMAAAFAAVVTTFSNLLLSLIPVGATDFWDTKFGLFLTALVSFLVIAVVVYLVEESEVRLMSRADAIERLNLIWSQEA